MKKLNRKGFTLIELLAVIVILAIIVVVTVPTVLNSIGDARKKTFNTSADTVADWIEKEYALYEMGTPDPVFNTWATTNLSKATAADAAIDTTGKFANIMGLLNTAGVKESNYSAAAMIITGNRVCVKLTASNSGDFATLKDADKTAYSLGCNK